MFAVSTGGEASELLDVADEVGIRTETDTLGDALNSELSKVFAVVDAAALEEKGIIRDCKYGLKVLSNGTLTKKLTVKAAAFSESAKAKIEEAGGKAEVV